MKKLLLFAFLMLVISVSAQFNKQSKDLTKDQYNDFATEIISTTGKEYVLAKEDKKDNYIKYRYVNKNDKSDELIISTYTLLLDVTNTSKGWTSWNVSKISGQLKTVFPIWQKFVNPNESIDYISTNEITKHGIGVRIMNMQTGSGDYWTISI